jgi:hypothetical protein
MPTTPFKLRISGSYTTRNSCDVPNTTKDNGPPDDIYVIPTAHAPSVSPGAVNNFPAFSRHLRTIRYPKDFKPAIEK